MWQQLISSYSDFSKEASASFFYCFFLLLFLRIGLLLCLQGLAKDRMMLAAGRLRLAL